MKYYQTVHAYNPLTCRKQGGHRLVTHRLVYCILVPRAKRLLVHAVMCWFVRGKWQTLRVLGLAFLRLERSIFSMKRFNHTVYNKTNSIRLNPHLEFPRKQDLTHALARPQPTNFTKEKTQTVDM